MVSPGIPRPRLGFSWPLSAAVGLSRPPPAYPGRTPHIHAKLQGPGTALLTTQLYFPDEPVANADDPIFSPALVIDQEPQPDGSVLGRFDFVLVGG